VPSRIVVVGLVGALAATGCGDKLAPLVPGEPVHFKLAVPESPMHIGIDLEIRLPHRYRPLHSGPDHWSWKGGKSEPWVSVATPTPFPRVEATPDEPCGKPGRGYGEVIDQRIVLDDGLLVACAVFRNGVREQYSVIRFLRSIETPVACEVYSFDAASTGSAQRRGAALDICRSLRVLGRSEYTDEDSNPGTGTDAGTGR
jgi:hypothetical protein